MKKKVIMLIMAAVLSLSSAVPVFAAPETMADGTLFDAEYYAKNNPDVVNVFGNSTAKLYEHYKKFGKAEGRLATQPFDINKVPGFAGAHVVATEYDNVFGKRVIERYSNGITTQRTEVPMRGECFYEMYWIKRTDFSDGLKDADHNGIDDRDPYNSCGYTDLNLNGIADFAPPIPNEMWSPEDYDGGTPKDTICMHGVVDGFRICPKSECQADRDRAARCVIY